MNKNTEAEKENVINRTYIYSAKKKMLKRTFFSVFKNMLSKVATKQQFTNEEYLSSPNPKEDKLMKRVCNNMHIYNNHLDSLIFVI